MGTSIKELITRISSLKAKKMLDLKARVYQEWFVEKKNRSIQVVLIAKNNAYAEYKTTHCLFPRGISSRNSWQKYSRNCKMQDKDWQNKVGEVQGNAVSQYHAFLSLQEHSI